MLITKFGLPRNHLWEHEGHLWDHQNLNGIVKWEWLDGMERNEII